MSVTSTTTTTRVRVLVADDHVVFAELLALALQAEPDLVCCARAATAGEALRLVDEQVPDVVVVDLHLGSHPRQGLELISRLRQAGSPSRVVVLTAQRDPLWAGLAERAGADAFLQKDGELRQLISTVRQVHGGVRGRGLPGPRRAPARAVPVTLDPLTQREEQVLTLLGDGMRPGPIAQLLGLRPSTVRRHILHLRRKLHASTQVEAVVRASRNGLLAEPPGPA